MHARSCWKVALMYWHAANLGLRYTVPLAAKVSFIIFWTYETMTLYPRVPLLIGETSMLDTWLDYEQCICC